MARVRVTGLQKAFASHPAVQGLSFELADGEFFCLLGPPGAGKTTTLRLIAGLEKPDSGEIWLGDEPMNGVHPMDRDVAMVFEDLALYPHWTAFENLAHPLRLRRLRKEDVRQRVEEVARLLRIETLLQRRPGTFSGGERRRVAIGRALVRRPRVLLLDQPFTDLDAKIRQEMSNELKRLQLETRQTMIYATHDFEEAVGMADRIMVVHQGRAEQIGTPYDVYERPASAFVAAFVGSPAMNLLPAKLEEKDGHVEVVHPALRLRLPRGTLGPLPSDVLLGIRPEHLIVRGEVTADDIPATAEIVQLLGEEQIVDLRLDPTTVIKAIVPLELEVAPGARLGIRVPPQRALLFDAQTGLRVLRPR
ncbi:MAG: ABC transporter ATP-binding protein [Chloroflexota bacterium]